MHLLLRAALGLLLHFLIRRKRCQYHWSWLQQRLAGSAVACPISGKRETPWRLVVIPNPQRPQGKVGTSQRWRRAGDEAVWHPPVKRGVCSCLKNQCVFIRGFKVELRPCLYTKLFKPIKLSNVADKGLTLICPVRDECSDALVISRINQEKQKAQTRRNVVAVELEPSRNQTDLAVTEINDTEIMVDHFPMESQVFGDTDPIIPHRSLVISVKKCKLLWGDTYLSLTNYLHSGYWYCHHSWLDGVHPGSDDGFFIFLFPSFRYSDRIAVQ